MKKRCFAASDSHGLIEIPADSVPEGTAEGCVWIDVEEYADDELSAWLRAVGFSPASIRASTQVRGRTRVSQFDEDVFFELPALAADIGSERVALAFLCRPGLCVTIHQKPVEGLARTANRLTRDGGLSEPSVTVLLGALLAGLSTRAVDAADEIRRQVLEMQNAMDLDPSELDAGEIHDLSSAVRTLDSVISERVVVLDRLRLLQSPTLHLADNPDLKAADTEANYLDRVIDRLEKRLNDVRDQHALNQQERTNKRLAILTSLSAVFLPLTLIAGIYGMNFQSMPELSFTYGYPIVLSSMAILGIGMILILRARGWFD